MKRQIASFISAFLLAGTIAYAGPAMPGQLKQVQPDGSTIYIKISGDEYINTVTDLQGHALAKNSKGYWCYARYDNQGNKFATEYIAGKQAPANILSQSTQIPHATLEAKGMQLRAKADGIRAAELGTCTAAATSETTAASTPRKGSIPPIRHAVVIYAENSDVPFTYPAEDIEALFSEKNHTRHGATGSVTDYMNEQLMGEVDFQFVMAPSVKLPQNQKYYGAEMSGTGYALRDACKAADEAGFDFSQFDDDGDGQVDCVFLVVSGRAESDGGGEDCIWPHQYYLKDGWGIDLRLDGVRINRYTVSCELALHSSEGKVGIATIGAMCHEFSHSIGLADMYDTDDYGSGGYSNGLWCTGLMDQGVYNNDGKTPPHFSAVDYDTLGYAEFDLLTEGEQTLQPVTTQQRFFKHQGSTRGDYYLFEARAKEGWDSYLGGAGLMIYHIDRSNNTAYNYDSYGRLTGAYTWMYNVVNSAPSHMCADVVEPTSNTRNASQVFFPYGNHTEFTPFTSPAAFKYWTGEESDLSIRGISIDADGSAKFKVVTTKSLLIPDLQNFNCDTFQNEAIIRWEASNPEYEGYTMVKVLDGKDTVLPATKVEGIGDGKFVYRMEGLEPDTDYTIQLYFTDGASDGDASRFKFKTSQLGMSDDAYILVARGNRSPLVLLDKPEGITSVKWFFNSLSVEPGPDGWYTFKQSGKLKAIITYEDGDTETIIKEIIL